MGLTILEGVYSSLVDKTINEQAHKDIMNHLEEAHRHNEYIPTQMEMPAFVQHCRMDTQLRLEESN